MITRPERDAAGVALRSCRRSLYRPGRLARHTGILLVGLGVRTAAQGLLFILLAQALGARGYGEFVAALAVATLFAPLVGCGATALMVRATARRSESFPVEFGRGLKLIGLTGVPLVGVVLGAAPWALGPTCSWGILVPVTVAELLCAPLVEFGGGAFQALERPVRAAILFSALAVLRLGGLLVLLDQGAPLRPEAWAVWHLAASALAAAWAMRSAAGLGRPRWSGGLRRAAQEGFFFALGGASHRAQADLDKAILARFDGAGATGVYSAAYRFADLATLPVQALLAASLARFFRVGEGGTRASLRYAVGLLPVPVAYALLAGLTLALGADFLPRLLGPSFAGAAEVVRWLAPLPLVTLLRSFLATVAGASDRQRLNGIVHGLGATCNAGLNLLWIPLWGWRGAVLATFASEGLMILLLLRDAGRR
ncbi:lipopolysaccharide biosynthesis protein [Candidatus Methylocalor cossyra]|uniref:Polysacc_synt_C domain-containing protein n=1 Tax=Candidatus Methylocalor cossyra TaxID=3108543 RepID=A0ABP1C744_9GAMM